MQLTFYIMLETNSSFRLIFGCILRCKLFASFSQIEGADSTRIPHRIMQSILQQDSITNPISHSLHNHAEGIVLLLNLAGLRLKKKLLLTIYYDFQKNYLHQNTTVIAIFKSKLFLLNSFECSLSH
jgi:hypothetical protein